MSKQKLLDIYDRLYKHFGPQDWWPADSAFEVAIGAILTHNTSWQNVERAIANLKAKKALSFDKMYRMKEKTLASLIRPAGYYNIKASRIKSFLGFLKNNYKGHIKNMTAGDWLFLRSQLLGVKGVGPETADSILLYALDKPIFVVDAYTKRIFTRHGLAKVDDDYASVQRLFMEHLKADTKLFNEYHALLVKLGKDFCKKSKKLCNLCPINEKN